MTTPKPWLKFYDPGLPHTLQPYPNKTLLDVLDDTVHQRPQHEAMIFKGRSFTASQLEQLSDTFARALISIGVTAGERVAMLLPNSPQSIIAQLGVWKAGAIICPLNPLYTAWELEHALNECGATTLIVLNPFYEKIKSIQAKTPLKRIITSNIKDYLQGILWLLFTLAKEKKEGYRIHLHPGDYAFPELMQRHQESGVKLPTVSPQDSAILLFSGGTTGKPKAVLATHHNLLVSAMQLHAYASKLLDDWTDRITVVMPMFHIYGNMAVNTSIVARWSMVIVPNPRDLDDLIATIRKERPAVLHGVPTLFNSLLHHPDVIAGKVDFKSMKVCYSAAAPLMTETRQRFEQLTGGRLLEAYAMTETVLAAVVCPTQSPYKEGSTGVPLPDVELRIVDVDTGETDLAANEVGEVVIRAPQIMQGYWNRPEETAQILRNGWIFTGDIGYLDEDGYLFLIDRKKDLIKPSGFQVWPREVEEIIAAHPAVAEVCVGGIPDETHGEAVKAWVVLRPGKAATEQEIRDFCREKLTGYKVPRQVAFMESLPKTMVGKTLRRVLLESESK